MTTHLTQDTAMRRLDWLAREVERLQHPAPVLALVLLYDSGRLVLLLPGVERPAAPPPIDGPVKKGGRTPWLARLERVAAHFKIALEAGPVPEGTLGMSLRGRRVRLRRDISEVDQTVTLAHELGHILLGHFDRGCRLVREACELEAEAVSWLVATQLNLFSHAPEQLAATGARTAHLRATRRKISRVACRILGALGEISREMLSKDNQAA